MVYIEYSPESQTEVKMKSRSRRASARAQWVEGVFPKMSSCSVCGVVFDADRRPDVLPCGHAPCQLCVVNSPSTSSEKRCPVCCKRFRVDSFAMLDPISVWCLECEAAPSPSCIDEHSFCSVKRVLRERSGAVTSTYDAVGVQLQRAEETLQLIRLRCSAAVEKQDMTEFQAHARTWTQRCRVLQEALEEFNEAAGRQQDDALKAEDMEESLRVSVVEAVKEECDEGAAVVHEAVLLDDVGGDKPHEAHGSVAEALKQEWDEGAPTEQEEVLLNGVTGDTFREGCVSVLQAPMKTLDEGAAMEHDAVLPDDISEDTETSDDESGETTDSEVTIDDEVRVVQPADAAGPDDVILNPDETTIDPPKVVSEPRQDESRGATTEELTMEWSDEGEPGTFVRTDGAAGRSTGSTLESLPDHILHAVLALVPAKDLLRLRLVNRRWSKLCLAKPVWRHRSLVVRDAPPFPAILRLVPALSKVTLRMEGRPLKGIRCLKALAAGSCKVVCLNLSFVASVRSNAAVRKTLIDRARSLKTLEITISQCMSTSDLLPVLEGIDSLSGLKCLTVNFDSPCPDGFRFKHLALDTLSVRGQPWCISENVSRSLLSASKDTLRDVSLASCEPVKKALLKCSKLAVLRVTSCNGLTEVAPSLPHLQWIYVYNCSLITQWLLSAEAQNLAAKQHIQFFFPDAYTFRLFLKIAKMVPMPIHSLEVGFANMFPSDLVTQCLQVLPRLEALKLDGSTDYMKVVREWSVGAAPLLRKLTIQCERSKLRSVLRKEFKRLQPLLELSFMSSPKKKLIFSINNVA